jgi:hypothetical protein
MSWINSFFSYLWWSDTDEDGDNDDSSYEYDSVDTEEDTTEDEPTSRGGGFRAAYKSTRSRNSSANSRAPRYIFRQRAKQLVCYDCLGKHGYAANCSHT